MLRFSEDFFRFVLFLRCFWLYFSENLPLSESCERRFSWKFRENLLKIGTLASVFPFFDSRSVYYGDPTLIFLLYDLHNISYCGKRILKKIQFVRKIFQFFSVDSRFFSLRALKGIAGLFFHYSAQFSSFAFRNFIFLGRFRNTELF